MITTELCLAVACALLLLVIGVIIAEVLLYKQFRKSNESSQQVSTELSTELSKVSDNVRAVSKSIDTFTRIELMQRFTPEWDKDVWRRELEKLQEDDESS